MNQPGRELGAHAQHVGELVQPQRVRILPEHSGRRISVFRIYEEYPDVQKEPLNNVLSGAEINLPVGEGLLDFLYADFQKPYRDQIEFIALLKQFVAAGRDENEEQEIPKAQRLSEKTVKVRKQSQTIAERFYQYEDTMTHARALTYASLYSAICPPLFRDGGMHEKALRYYYAYLRSVQKE